MPSKHTAEPWIADDCSIETPDGTQLLFVSGACTSVEQDEANAQRIVACVNACRGINPKVVPDLLRTLRRAAGSGSARRNEQIEAVLIEAREE